MKRDCGWLKQYGLLVGKCVRHAEELLLVEQHILAPPAADWLLLLHVAPLAQLVIARGAGAAERMQVTGDTVWPVLQRDAISYMQVLDIFAHLNDLADHFMAGIRMRLSW